MQLAAETGQAGSLSIRIFCRGRELRHHELAASIGTSPVHYVLCPEGPLSRASSVDYGAAGLLDSYDLPREQTDDQDAWVRTCLAHVGFAIAAVPPPPPPLRCRATPTHLPSPSDQTRCGTSLRYSSRAPAYTTHPVHQTQPPHQT